MLNISFGELLVFAIIALIILGPEKLPQTLRSATIKYRQLKNTMNKIQQDFENELELAELKRLMDVELDKIKANEEYLKAQLAQMQQEIDQLNQDVIEPEATSSEIKHTETTHPETTQSEIKPAETIKIKTELNKTQQPVAEYLSLEYQYSPLSAVRIPYRDYLHSPLQYVRKVA